MLAFAFHAVCVCVVVITGAEACYGRTKDKYDFFDGHLFVDVWVLE